MSRPRDAVPPEEQAQLYGRALRLTEEFCARLRKGDDTGAEAFTREREALLQRIGSGGDESLRHQEWRRKSVAAIERILALDREIVTLLEERKARLGRELLELGRGRRTLAAYRGPSALSPTFVDRMG
jgi:hypothetical protein